MKKNLIISALLCCTFYGSTLFAQDKRTTVFGVEQRTNAFEIGAEYLKPTGSFDDLFGKTGYGVAARFRYGITKHKSMLFSLGYEHFEGEAISGFVVGTHYNPKVSFIPAKFGLFWQIAGPLYVAGEIGITLSPGVKNYEKFSNELITPYDVRTLLFNATPSIGLHIPIAKNYIDLGARYEVSASNKTYGFTAIRAAYAFDIPRKN